MSQDKKSKLRPTFLQSVLGLAKFVQTKSGNQLLLDIDGYVYNRSSQNGTTLYWCCRNKDNKRCLARAITEKFFGQPEYVTSWKGVHTHEPNLRESDVILN